MMEQSAPLVDLDIPFVPPLAHAVGQKLLVYELFLHNSSERRLQLKRVEVLPAESGALAPPLDAAPLVVLTGQELTASTLYLSETLRPARPAAFDSRRLACVFLWVPLEAGRSWPGKLFHRVVFQHEEDAREYITLGAPLGIDPGEPLLIAAPLAGENWLALQGPANTSTHRRALLPGGATPFFPQRFAIDWVRIGRDGKLYTADPARKENWHGYGAEVFSVGSGVVAALQDGLCENEPLAKKTALPLTLKNAAGNYLVIDLGNQQYALYAHLQPGSLRVQVGERVRKGKVLARLGISGNAAMPHLHFHIGSTASPLASQGLPYAIDSFLRGGAGKIPSRREREIPLENMAVSFSS